MLVNIRLSLSEHILTDTRDAIADAHRAAASAVIGNVRRVGPCQHAQILIDNLINSYIVKLNN